MKTFAIKVAYNGAPFSGFARQPDACTVQGELEQSLLVLFRREVLTVCAGRTDAGVHARGQVVSFELEDAEVAEFDQQKFLRSMNAITSPEIAIRDVWEAPDGFSARFDARSRTYKYFFCIDKQLPVFMADFSWHTGPLDEEAMERASRCLIGEQDFKSFCRSASAIDKPTCRNVLEIFFEQQELFGEHFVVMTIVGSSFLHSMVRTIAGTLVEVGRGRRPEQWVQEVLEACDRVAAGECAPAQGLVFWEVAYD